ncbi:shikimate dehydrogenase [Microbacterium amylolyticum]|uniref:Shikimate dehydrogenase n=1 Tax=Microbacterium amylolyticum TaxID=936337 RepID=A0ABS4ZE19_9MICO|nr:shikimate dehydrogenase [Microbacterium amylolyticum]MBP2435532.1 shikimate dehydrogenase [Microbacterium amylolyticum]
MTNLEVWGSPITHSRSPELHGAAYRALGLTWDFARREVTEEGFSAALSASSVRGLAVTYPLKEAAFRAAAWRDSRAELTGVANTLFFGASDGLRGYNTDVAGMMSALREAGVTGPRSVRIVGAGATATSAVVAAAEMGAERIEMAARRPESAERLIDLGTRMGVAMSARAMDSVTDPVELTIATLPGGAVLPPGVVAGLSRSGGTLFDVAYSPWPSVLASAWVGEVHHGLGMLLHQAVIQVRIFVSGDPEMTLDDEPRLIAAMRAALG